MNLMIVEQILQMADKFFPNKEHKLEFELELRKLENENFKEKKGMLKSILHLVLPTSVLVLVVMYSVEFYLRVTRYLQYGEFVTISIVPSGLEIFCLIFVSLLMPKKIMEVVVPVAIKYMDKKRNRS